MKALVTGCHGYIGGHLIERLLGEEHEVVGVDHRPVSWQTFEKLGRYCLVELELGDRQTVPALARVLEGVAVVFHLASHQPFNWEPAPFIYGNICRTAAVIEAMRLAGVKRLVQSSTCAVYGDSRHIPLVETDPAKPQGIYALTKYQAEMLAQAYSELGHIKTTVLRYSSVYGGRNRVGSLYYFIEMSLKGAPIRLFAKGKTVRDYVYVDDVVHANLACLLHQSENAFEIFNIGSGDPTSTGNLVQVIAELTGRSATVAYAEDEHWQAADLYPDISKARQQLGYHPVDMRAGMERYLRTLEAAVKVEGA